MTMPLRVLLVEDSEDDAALLVRQLRRDGFTPEFSRVETGDEMSAALTREWDVILADHALPHFSAEGALDLMRRHGLALPFLVISGQIGEESAVALIRRGADDYLLKDRLGRLGTAVHNAREQHRLRTESTLAERRFRALVEHNADGIGLLDLGGTLRFASPSLLRMLGPVSDDPDSRNLLALVHPDDLPTLTSLLAGFAHRKDGRASVQFRCLDPQGTWRWLDGIFSNLLAEPSVSAIVCNCRDVTELKVAERRRNELELARGIQRGFIPVTPQLSGLDIAGLSNAADVTGGDYFDFIPLDRQNLAVVLGDVSGHSIGAALILAQTRAYLRALSLPFRHNGRRDTDCVSRLLALLNRAFLQDMPRDQFATLALARIDLERHVVEFVGAGHPEGHVFNADGTVKATLTSLGVPLGVDDEETFPPGTPIPLVPGDLLLLYTDGLVEATNPGEEQFGVPRILDLVRSCQREPARRIVAALYEAVRSFSGPRSQLDDITVVVLKVESTPGHLREVP